MGRRQYFVPIRRRRAAIDDATKNPGAAEAVELKMEEAPGSASSEWISNGTAGLDFFAPRMWRSAYESLFIEEHEHNIRAAGGQSMPQLPPSTYRKRLKGESALRYDWRRLQQERDQLAIALHANNQQHWSPSMLARSITYFNLASEIIQQTECHQRRLASRPVTFKFLRMMRDCRWVISTAARHEQC